MNTTFNILVTGASGYIGSAFLERSRFKNHLISFTGRIPETNPEDTLTGVDVIVHLAARVPRVKSTPETIKEDREVNEEWSLKLARAAAKKGVRLLFVSTSSVYAGRGGRLLSEETPYIGPQGSYAASKLAVERALKELKHAGLRYTTLRFGSVFGLSPHMHYRTISAYIQKAAQGEPLEIWREGITAVRPYTYIGDCVSAIDFVLERDLFSGETFNVVSLNITTQEIIEHLRKVFADLVTTLVDHERMNDFSYGMDDSKIQKLGFRPTGRLEVAISELAGELKK